MNQKLIFVYVGILFAVLLGAAFISETQPNYKKPLVPPVSNGITLPLNYREDFVNYLTVDRVDNFTRDIWVDPAVIPLMETGRPLPEGTKIVIEAFAGTPGANGRLVKGAQEPFIHVAEKRDGWSLEDLPVSSHVGKWNFASFDSRSFQPSGENLNDCFTCHDDSASTRLDFTFSRSMLDVFAASGVKQYQYCNRPDRLRCF